MQKSTWYLAMCVSQAIRLIGKGIYKLLTYITKHYILKKNWLLVLLFDKVGHVSVMNGILLVFLELTFKIF